MADENTPAGAGDASIPPLLPTSGNGAVPYALVEAGQADPLDATSYGFGVGEVTREEIQALMHQGMSVGQIARKLTREGRTGKYSRSRTQ